MMGLALKKTFAGIVTVTLLICSSSSSLIAVAADDSKPKSAAANNAADLTSDHTKEEKEPLTIAVQLTNWLNFLEGGHFNAKQEIRSVNDGGSNGIFASKFIAKGELLAQIPWEYIINDEEDDDELSVNDSKDAGLECGTIRNLVKEMKKVETLGKDINDPNSASKYGPYGQYMFNEPDGILPSAWSQKGKAMLNEVLRGNYLTLPPEMATTWFDFLEDCNGEADDELSAKAAMLVVARSDDELLIPVYDMYNHRNGHWHNTHNKITDGENYIMTASRDIQPGEQIYNSYNMCENCEQRESNGYGTPEIFRDYGFVEEFPQRFNFEKDEIMFDLAESKDGEIVVKWEEKPKTLEDRKETNQVIMKEIRRLVKTRKMIWESDFQNGKSTIKESEWNSIWEFHQTMVNALSYAFNDIVVDDNDKIPVGKNTCTSDGVCGFNYFDRLDWEEDNMPYNGQTCDNKEIMRFPNYYMLEDVQTHYQVMNFAYNTKHGDICMDLEDTVQICSSYRPHYHEFSSHFAARFVDDIKRVVFVGGGDSMMLHEVLKYPSLEKVVGLELDQTVVRKSFKYFKTQAHFDSDKVEWWFGDATKSLLLLPEDYWGSFDLVIVDLSETVMAFSVTEELDVFDALALLLKPEGVMVKNEHYMETMSETFDYTLQVYLGQNPKICSQCMIFGSNKANFFRKPVVEHGVETLLLPPVAELKDGYDYFQDFRKNNAMEQNKCNLDTEKKNETSQTKSAGLLHILDAEDVGVTLDIDTVEKIIMAAAKEEGFTKIEPNEDFKLATAQSITEPEDPKSTVVSVVFKEGYASARIWPRHNYIAVDVGVWGSFQNGNKLRQRIGKDLNAKTTSFFRVVVGGMFGSSTWEEDKDSIGPQIAQQRNCEQSTNEDVELSDNNVKKTIIDEVTNFVGFQNSVAAVFCGVEGVDKCPSVDVLEQHKLVTKVIPVWACPELTNIDDDDESGMFTKMIACEQHVLSTLNDGRVGEGQGIALIVLDGTTTYEMGQILHSILAVQAYHESLVAVDHFMMSFSKKSETWRRNLLDRYRKELYFDPVKLVQFDINIGGANMILDIISNHIMTGFKAYNSLEEKLSKQLALNDAEASVELISLTGGMFNFQHDFDPHYYLQEDYPVEPGNEQYKAQKPLGRKTVVQYDQAKGKPIQDLNHFVSFIDSFLIGRELYQFEVYTDVGDGAVVVSDIKAGSLIAIWDGRGHVDLNIFLHDDDESEIKDFIQEFTKLTKNELNMGLRDDFPRGTGRVMNFRADLTYHGFDSVQGDLVPYTESVHDDD